MRFMIAVWLAIVVGLVGTGGYMLWTSFVTRPAVYAALRTHGVPTTGHLLDCTGNSVGSRGYAIGLDRKCRITYVFAQTRHEHAYPNSFKNAGDGAAIHLLVDPKHPGTAFTTADVKANRGAGWEIHAYIGLALALAGAALFFGARALQ
jgi:hypothetical protein